MAYPPQYGAASSAPNALPTGGYGFPGPGGDIVNLGALGQADGGLGAAGYGITSAAGAALGGGITGFLAAGTPQGAITGGSFTAGLASVGNAFLFMGEKRGGLALVFGLIGAGGIGWSLWRFWRRR